MFQLVNRAVDLDGLVGADLHHAWKSWAKYESLLRYGFDHEYIQLIAHHTGLYMVFIYLMHILQKSFIMNLYYGMILLRFRCLRTTTPSMPQLQHSGNCCKHNLIPPPLTQSTTGIFMITPRIKMRG